MTLLKPRRGDYSLVSEKLPQRSQATGRALQELPFPRDAVVRRGEIAIPGGSLRFEEGDEVLALVGEASMQELGAVFSAG